MTIDKLALATEIYNAWMDAPESIIDTYTPCGLRGMYRDQNTTEGATIPNSYNWDDGEILTEEELEGTCAIKLNNTDCNLTLEECINAVNIAINRDTIVYGDGVLSLIIGSRKYNGEDYGEVIISDAKVYKSWNLK